MRSTVEVAVCLWTFPRIRSWISLAVSWGTMGYVLFILGLVWVDGSVVVTIWINVLMGGFVGGWVDE